MFVLHLLMAVFLLGYSADGSPTRRVSLTLPHPPATGETIWLKVEVGEIGHNQVHVTTSSGRELGTISTYGVKSGKPAGTYTLPVPADAMSGTHLTVLLSIIQGRTEHAASLREVKAVSIGLRPAKP
ncbi:hypothetical protein [Occallatibacter riparius]|uniref:Uncharacterized protein n=1 Tax=Occallatibacter riparius TaxID=1002689 RepID=A0A9J7BGN1_9BACT|nr:hypothetical protein [Occallatibacter riparius]UWZ81944.1 hypothetical protein MOP44_15315 [Occallatibacter riparius]